MEIKLKPKDKIYYVNNKSLFEAYKNWYASIETAKSNCEDYDLPIPDFIVDSMIKICTRLSYKPNFINYSFRDDLISDALYDCVRFAKKFNPEKTENPFSYITTIAFSAFLRRIDSEKKQSYVKAKIISETPTHDFFDSIEADDIELQENFIEYMNENNVNLINNEPMAIKRKRKKQQEMNLLKDLQADFIDEVSIEDFSDE